MVGQHEPKLGGLPTSIEQALQPSRDARIITEPNEPFRILHVNEVWCQACGFDAEDALGQTCRILQGLGTCRATLQMLRQALLLKRNFAVQLLNYTKRGRPFMSTLQVAPLVDSDSQVTHYLGVVIARFLDGGATVPPSIQVVSDRMRRGRVDERGDMRASSRANDHFPTPRPERFLKPRSSSFISSLSTPSFVHPQKCVEVASSPPATSV